MYYGYNKYRDMFVSKKTNVDKTIKKNVIFIDIGYSKTTFIFSTFNYAYFKVKYVKSHSDLGARDFNIEIMKYCIEEFNNKNKEKFKDSKNSKLKLRLLNAIEAGRKSLSINKNVKILVESFYKDEDLECEITKESFKKIVNRELEIFKQ
jgi:molecular chaperone DnaK (HSP70)